MASKPKAAKSITVNEAADTSSSHNQKSSSTIKRIPKSRIFISAIIVVIFLIPVGYYFYNQKSTNSSSNLKTVSQITNRVSKHMLLPTGETPTPATVTNVEVLKDNPFFANAQYGDKVLVYTQAKVIILYRPSIDRIVKVGHLDTNPATKK